MSCFASRVCSWHTGNAVTVTNTTNMKAMHPDLFRQRVAQGFVEGLGRARSGREKWNMYVERVFREMMFPF